MKVDAPGRGGRRGDERRSGFVCAESAPSPSRARQGQATDHHDPAALERERNLVTRAGSSHGQFDNRAIARDGVQS